ncbi:GNAT family protein [Daejeonella sp.]|uniref:GNAT family N-acetyltransferase n=1 Tax=Daejeonella sp. TaxID=2805397 RepID=UPI0025C488A9|nr:GNAT family protein [Daejeonella sp.]
MNYSIYLRELYLSDAKISFNWRNNPIIWKYTGFKPDKIITEKIELEWLRNALKKPNDHRFAICLKKNSQYIGNVQLTNVQSNTAEFHLFIGDPSFWGMGIGKQATSLMLNFGFTYLELHSINLEVHKENYAAKALYKKIGFSENGMNNDFLKMILHKDQVSAFQDKTIPTQFPSVPQ